MSIEHPFVREEWKERECGGEKRRRREEPLDEEGAKERRREGIRIQSARSQNLTAPVKIWLLINLNKLILILSLPPS